MAQFFDRTTVRQRSLRRSLNETKSNAKEALAAVAELAEASTALLARHFGGDPADTPEVEKMREARDKANELLYRMRKDLP